ncbi:MAG: metal-dependent hydrolase [Chloroflexota bacterium]
MGQLTRGTHQVGAFAAALGALAFLGPAALGSDPVRSVLDLVGISAARPPVGWPSLAGFFVCALLGGTAPDLDKPRQFWARALAHTAFGGHRHLSHSLVGLILASAVVGLLLGQLGRATGIALALPFLGFMAGYVSHLVLDSLTIEGVPWLFPLPAYLGVPPWSGLRVRTGHLVEQLLVMPALLGLIGWLGYRGGDALAAWWK